MAIRIGIEAKLYRNTGSGGSPTWSEITNAREVTLNLEAAEVDATRRGSGGWREILSGLKDASIEFELVYDPEDAHFQAIKDAYFQNDTLEIAALDAPVAENGEGLRAVMSVINFSRNEPLEEVLTVNVTLKPAPNETPPSWMS